MRITRPIFIVGAPRTGKKMTAEVFNQHPDVCAFEYEMNFLWRYGHASYPYDTLKPSMLNERIKKYITQTFEKKIRAAGKSRIVDRTDHNVVRLHYVRAVFPDCLILHVVRDGRAAVSSAIKRRQVKRGLKPYLEKAKTVPLRDLPYYGCRYLADIIVTRLFGRGYKELWGMRTPAGDNPEQRTATLAQKCAFQWRDTTAAGLRFAKEFTGENYLQIRYEDAIERPVETYRKIFKFAGLGWRPQIGEWLVKNISAKSLNPWKKDLSEKDLSEILPIISGLMKELNYFEDDEKRVGVNP